MIEKNNLIKKISKAAKVNLTQATKAYETVLKENPAFRRQAMKTVTAKKEVAVKIKGKPVIKKIQLIKEVPVEVVKKIEVIKKVEVVKEVPVIVEKEIIKEVQIVKEVPVEVIKEVTLVREVEVVKVKEVIKKEVDLKAVKKWEAKYAALQKKYDKMAGEIAGYKQKLKEKPKTVEVIKEIEVIKEVPVEIIKEVEVVKSIDFNSLQAMMKKLDTVQVSKTVVGETRTRKEGTVVERREVKGKAKTKATAKKTKAKAKKDDLKKIEGVGPKIEQLLHAGGIKTFNALSKAKVSVVKGILDAAGPRFRMHDPGSWAKQAKLADTGKWDALKKLQDELDGGK